VDEGALTDMNC